jgi:putative ABC transport system ATP-binding protein
MEIVQIRDLRKEYRSGKMVFEALKGLSFDIYKGEILSILGPSGCGKTTLLNCLSSIDHPTNGKVFIEGYDLHALSDNEKTRFRAKNMGFIFQFYNLIPVLTVAENVELPLFAIDNNRKNIRKTAEEVLTRLGLGERLNYFPADLSGGERQRVSIARALVHAPKIIWADEPTGALDTQTGREIMDIILDLNEKNGQTFVLVTHDERIADYSNRIIYMDSGQIVKIREISSVKAK